MTLKVRKLLQVVSSISQDIKVVKSTILFEFELKKCYTESKMCALKYTVKKFQLKSHCEEILIHKKLILDLKTNSMEK